jgi:hypothetical protein
MKLLKWGFVVLVLAMLVMVPSSASAAQGSLAVPVVGTAGGFPAAGTFNITNFAVNNGKVVANGTVTFLSNGIQYVTQATAVVTDATGSCPVLDLTLGPLDLNLLGLVVHLDQVHLNITAQSGPGNLLGNLLCAVANLLNGGLNNVVGGLLNQLVTLLNQILAQL